MVNERIDDNQDTHPDDTTEGPIQGILAGILMNIMALVSFTFLQLWLREDSRETPSKLAIGLKLVQQFLTRGHNTNNLFKSDFRIQGENYEAWPILTLKIFPTLNIYTPRTIHQRTLILNNSGRVDKI